MRDDALVRFTAHEIPREDLHALMARSDGPALRRGVWHLGMLVLIGAALWRLRSTAWALPLVVVQGYMLAFIFCDRASDGLPDPLAQSGAGDAGRAPGFLALSELSRVPLGAPPIHARPGAGSRALLPEARLPAHVPLRVDRDSKCRSSDRRHSATRFRPGGATLDGAVGAAASHHRGARVPDRVPRGGGGLDRRRLARRARRVDRSVDGRAGVPAAVSAGRAHGLRVHA